MNKVNLKELPIGTKIHIIDAGYGVRECNNSDAIITDRQSYLHGMYSNIGVYVEIINSDICTVGSLWKISPTASYEIIPTNSFTKSDLKNGDVLVRRNGDVEICMIDTGTLICRKGYNLVSTLSSDLTNWFSDEFDVVRVYRPRNPHQCSFEYYKDADIVYSKDSDIHKWAEDKVKECEEKGYHYDYDSKYKVTFVYNLSALKSGYSHCSENDIFNKNIGIAVAYCRAEGIKLPKELKD